MNTIIIFIYHFIILIINKLCNVTALLQNKYSSYYFYLHICLSESDNTLTNTKKITL
jgi:hypothetical protein